jgi:hypothetical protein
MIVREDVDGTLGLVSQNDHALVSGTLAAHWGNEQFCRPNPYDSVVRAAAFHDRGWIDYEAKPTLDQNGRPPNYRDVPTDDRQLRAYQWTSDWLGAIDEYSGLLAAKHRTGLWQSRYGTIKAPTMVSRGKLKPEIEAFIARSEARQRSVETQYDVAQVRTNYHLLQVWDMISLYLCSTAVLEPLNLGPAPMAYGSEAVSYLLLSPAGTKRVVISPYPLDQPEVRVAYVYRKVQAQPFDNADAFREAYFKAPLNFAEFALVPG